MKWDLLTWPHAGHLTKFSKGLIFLSPDAYNFSLLLRCDVLFFGAALKIIPLSIKKGVSPVSSICFFNSSSLGSVDT